MTPIQQTSFETQSILATCQSLALLDGDLVGDPMEKATVKAIEWHMTKGTPKQMHKLGTKCGGQNAGRSTYRPFRHRLFVTDIKWQ